jgi:hypothetical protein
MFTGSWALTCALAVVGAPPVVPKDVTFLKDNRIEIPFNIDPARQSEIAALELYVSTNEGRSWAKAGVARANQTSFYYTAYADSFYWFTVRVIDKQNRREPEDLSTAPILQKVLVDTLKPEVRLKVQRRGESVAVSWEIKEEYPNLEKMKLEVGPAEGKGPWTPVSIVKGLTGQTTIQNPAAVAVRLEVQDLAKNAGVGQARVDAAPGARVAAAPLPSLESPSVPPVVGTPSVAESISAGPPPLPGSNLPSLPPPGEAEVATSVRAVPAATRPGDVVGRQEPPLRAPPPPAWTEPSTIQPVSVSTEAPKPPPALPEELPPRRSAGVVAASSAATGPEASRVTPVPEREAGLQVTNQRRVTMEYEVTRYGSSGIGGADLYVKRDGELNWRKIEGIHSAGTPAGKNGEALRRTLAVDLPEDGVYGFFLVVYSGAGLCKQEPRAGDAPQMRVEVDTTLPQAKLWGPAPSPHRKDTLLLKWEATDNRLGDRPITLEWAENKDGPWQHVGGPQVPNTGSLDWVIPANVPPRVYLRLTVRDVAGNVAVAETQKPVLVDLIRPEAKLIGLVRPR